RRHIARGDGNIFAMIAFGAPGVEIVFVVLIDAFDVGAELVGALEVAFVAGTHSISRAAAGDFALAGVHVDGGDVAVFVDVNFVSAGAKNGEGQVGSVDFKIFIFTEIFYADAHGAFGDADLRVVVVEIEEGKAGHAAEAKRWSRCAVRRGIPDRSR